MQCYIFEYISPVGKLDIVSDQNSIIGVWFQSVTPQVYYQNADRKTAPPIDAAIAWLDRYFAGERPSIAELPLHASGTLFQKTVWSILMQIPYGETMTYGQIGHLVATILGKNRMSAQAIGQAVSANPISIIIPCHRVIGAGGKLVGYASGLDHKIGLLKHEGWL